MKRRAAYTAMVIGLLLVAYNIVDRIERSTEARIAAAEAYRDGCLPGPGETAIIVGDGRRARCRIYSTRSLSPGMAPRLVSAAAVQIEVAP